MPDRSNPSLRLAMGLAGLIFLHLARVGLAAAGNIEVPGQAATIAQAIQAAKPGDIISIASGTYVEEVTIDKDLELVGAGPGTTILQGFGGRVVTVSASVTLRNLTITGGFDGIWVTPASSLKIQGVHLIGNSNYGVGFAESENTTADISDCFIANNRDGINLFSTKGRIVGNEVTSNTDDGIDLDGNTDVLIAGNRIRDSFDDGIEIRLAESTRATIIRNFIDGSGEDSIEVIDSFITACRDQPTSCSNRLTIRRNILLNAGRYGMGFVELPSEVEANSLLALVSLQCVLNDVAGSVSSYLSPNYAETCF